MSMNETATPLASGLPADAARRGADSLTGKVATLGPPTKPDTDRAEVREPALSR
jgi:hypothetical protein